SNVREAAHTAAVEFRALARSSAGAALLTLLDALEDVYSEQLRAVTPDKLGRVQGAAAQVAKLRALLVSRDDVAPPPMI
ncbi:MAG: hypothetical protein ACREE7_15565, partial [Dongiaceae bacterium]